MKVIITGASQGIGRGITQVLARAGCSVGLLVCSQSRLESIVEQIRSAGGTAQLAVCDLRDPNATEKAIKALIEDLDGLDALINNAGTVIRKDVFTLSLDEWNQMLETNISGVFYATRAVLSTFRDQGSGHIINVSSISGKLPLLGGSAYAATKFAVTGFSQSIFLELRQYGIKVTTLFPGSVDSRSHRHNHDDDHAWKVTPEEVGEACLVALQTRAENCISEIEIRPAYRPKEA